MAQDAPKAADWHAWTGADRIRRQSLGTFENFRRQSMSGAAPQWIIQDQTCRERDGKKGHRSGVVADEPAVLMILQLEVTTTIGQPGRCK